MKDWVFKVIIVVLILSVIGIYIYYADFSPKNPNIELINRINRLELKIDSLNKRKDSLRVVIDSTHIKIITNEKYYQERINTIITQPASADSGFISNYIRQYTSKNPQYNFN